MLGSCILSVELATKQSARLPFSSLIAGPKITGHAVRIPTPITYNSPIKVQGGFGWDWRPLSLWGVEWDALVLAAIWAQAKDLWVGKQFKRGN